MIRRVRVARTVREKEILAFASVAQRKQIVRRAKVLRGTRILHLNATAVGGGVAEILSSLVPYLRALGMRSDWYAIESKTAKRFFTFTNKLHNAFQGDHGKFAEFTERDWKFYRSFSEKIARDLQKLTYDILVVHDPQPLVAGCVAASQAPKIYFSHIDTSAAHKHLWKRVEEHIKQYDRIVFSNKEFIHAGLPKKKVAVFTPAIDPLAPKQTIIPTATAKTRLMRFGIDPKRPLIVQVSRFDVWKNPLGVIEAFRLVQQRAYPDAQLALVGFREAKDNPDADRIYRDVEAVATGDPNIHLFFDPRRTKDVGAFTTLVQNAADIVVQNSTKEGFGLTVTEAMWKEKPVIGGPASGIRRQIRNGRTGYIVSGPEELARRIINLLKYPKKRKAIGKAAKASVRKNFLFSRLVNDHLRLYEASMREHGAL